MRVFNAASNDEILQLHRVEHMHLIISDLEMPGISTKQLCSLIRKDPVMSSVSIIMVCACNRIEMERSLHIGANAVLLKPIKPPLLLAKAKQLLDINSRETFRVHLSVSVEGSGSDLAFFCRSLDITTTGILMETNHFLRLGDRVLCSFNLPDATRVQVMGKVVRTTKEAPDSEGSQYGIHFVDLAPDARKAIELYLDSAARKKHPDIY